MYGKYILENKYKLVLLIQVMEIALVIALMFVSMHAANRLAYDQPHPFGYYTCMLNFLVSTSIGLILLASKKYFNFFDTSFLRSVGKAVEVVFVLNVIMVVLMYFNRGEVITPYYFFIIGGFQTISLISIKILSNQFKEHIFQKQLSVIIGPERDQNVLVEALRKQTLSRVVFVSETDRQLYHFIDRADYVYLLIVSDMDMKQDIISYCELHNIRLFLVPESHEIALRDAEMTQIGDVPLFVVERYQLTEAQAIVKRALDILISAIGIVLVSPIILIVGILIKREDGGPIFYRQERCGLNKKPFNMIKIRSMIVDAEKWTGEVLAQENDPRITKVGRVIRATRIDETPQFFNVLLGHMSIVGPRPERPGFVEAFIREFPEYNHRFAVKPGITGLAQVMSNYTTTAENKLKFDLVYIKKYSPGFDLGILIKTVGVVLSRVQSQGVSVPANTTGQQVTNSVVLDAPKSSKSGRRYGNPYSVKKAMAILLCSVVVIGGSMLLRYTTLAIAAIEVMSMEVAAITDDVEEVAVVKEEKIPQAALQDVAVLSTLDIETRLDSIGSDHKIRSVILLLANLSKKELMMVEEFHRNGYTKNEIQIIHEIMHQCFDQDELDKLKELATQQQ